MNKVVCLTALPTGIYGVDWGFVLLKERWQQADGECQKCGDGTWHFWEDNAPEDLLASRGTIYAQCDHCGRFQEAWYYEDPLIPPYAIIWEK